ncbi:MAG: dihydroorotate dehydrogenase [Synergistales bacterium]|nr:dihydroorotate dehydrogenase [Synergistales bacterium]
MCISEGIRDFDGIAEKLQKITSRVFTIDFHCPEIAHGSSPGQFVMIRFKDRLDPLLGRPFAVASAKGDSFSVWFQVVGKMTALLSEVSPGEKFTVRGPLGNGFGEPSGDKLFLVAGTLGVAPLLKVYEEFSGRLDCEVHLGVPDKTWKPFTEQVRQLIPGLRIFSDDGSLGVHGTCLHGLPGEIGQREEIWACGPVGMLKALAERYPQNRSGIRVSLEARMACGIGGCQGCVIETVEGKRRVCVDGPVFSSEEVAWDEIR